MSSPPVMLGTLAVCLGAAWLYGRLPGVPGDLRTLIGVGQTASPGRMSPRRVVKLVPWFLIGFVVAAAINSAGVIPVGAHVPLRHASVFLVAVALSAIGLSTNVAALRKAGHRP